jgi:hypothetical protein
MILMMINGVYGGGAFVFFLFRLLNVQAGIDMKDLFIAYVTRIAFVRWCLLLHFCKDGRVLFQPSSRRAVYVQDQFLQLFGLDFETPAR